MARTFWQNFVLFLIYLGMSIGMVLVVRMTDIFTGWYIIPALIFVACTATGAMKTLGKMSGEK